MSTKAMSWFFLYITLLSIPIMVFYAKSGITQSSAIDSVFARLSLGNVGEGGYACSESQFGLHEYA